MNEAKEQKVDSEIALLAPVPLEHLNSAVTVKEWVAFGSRAFEVFDKLDKVRGDRDVDAYIYPSLRGESPARLWRATYIGMSQAEHDVLEHRPPTTRKETGWWIFWKVKDLRQVPDGDWRIGDMRGFGKSKNFNRFFIPEGPILIQHP